MGHSSSPFQCLCQKLSLTFYTLIKLCYTKALKWLRLVPGPEAKSSSSEFTNPTSITISYHSIQFSSVAQWRPTLCNPMNHITPGLPVHHQLPEFTQTHVHEVGDVIQPSHPLLSPSLPAPNPSQHQGLFQRVNSSHQVAKVLEFQLSISTSNEHTGLISFRMDWLDLLAAQGTLKSLLQHHSSKASILRCSASSQSNSHIHT